MISLAASPFIRCAQVEFARAARPRAPRALPQLRERGHRARHARGGCRTGCDPGVSTRMMSEPGSVNHPSSEGSEAPGFLCEQEAVSAPQPRHPHLDTLVPIAGVCFSL